jgi:hypothetical protein
MHGGASFLLRQICAPQLAHTFRNRRNAADGPSDGIAEQVGRVFALLRLRSW